MINRMSEQEFVASFDEALTNHHLMVYYQPQINHETGRMVGAEALLRWRHPAKGMQYPADFIPVLEKNNLIYQADLFVFEEVCILLRNLLENKKPVVPISVNMSRYDIYGHSYVADIETIRKKYDIPVKYIRVEVTESSAIGGMELITRVMDDLHRAGYIVEMDDFGSGYSSLGVLKDLPVDMLKLDMRFLQGNIGGRGGTIINSMVQMCKWLNTTVIAEGVETQEIADFMKTIGCKYVQGYLYAKPMPQEDFLKYLAETDHEPMDAASRLMDTMNNMNFWNPDSLENLIFSNFVGPAAVFIYENGNVEILRVNEKYLKEIGMSRTEQEILTENPWECTTPKCQEEYTNAINKAIKTRDEVTFECWRTICSKTCGENKICVRSTIRLIGEANNQYLFYAMVQNVTAEKERYRLAEEDERRFKSAFEHANVYAWEYTISTHEMRPCFRCMRDLGLPPIVKNYPDTAIEAGVFPPEVADMYRELMKEIDNGRTDVDLIIPLTVGRIPFHVRYTTEFDESGRPLKAYGSATLVVDNPAETPAE